MPALPTSVDLAQAVSSTVVTDGLALLDDRRGTIYHLNHTATVALSALIDGGYTGRSPPCVVGMRLPRTPPVAMSPGSSTNCVPTVWWSPRERTDRAGPTLRGVGR